MPTDLAELYHLYARDVDEGQLIHDLKSRSHSASGAGLYRSLSSDHSPRSTNGAGGGNNKLSVPILSQIAEEDLTSASTSVASFHLPNSVARRNQLTAALPPHRTLSDQDLFTRVQNNSNSQDFNYDLGSSTNQPLAYSHFNFDQSSKPQLAKGNSLVSFSSDSVDVPLNDSLVSGGMGATRRKVHTTSPPRDKAMDLSPTFAKTNPGQNKGKVRKQTQDIAAKAAQRRANLHHRELMSDMGELVER